MGYGIRNEQWHSLRFGESIGQCYWAHRYFTHMALTCCKSTTRGFGNLGLDDDYAVTMGHRNSELGVVWIVQHSTV
jgi:hypothetical protein